MEISFDYVIVDREFEMGDSMHIWTLWNQSMIHNQGDTKTRKGLHIRCEKGVDPEVKRALLEFGKWLRSEYVFPVRVTAYIKSTEYIKAMDGDLVSATFFGPFDKNEEPYIRLATGDYPAICSKRGKDNALASIIASLAHELTHYFQWLNDIKLTEIGIERQAKKYAIFILNEYSETREHP